MQRYEYTSFLRCLIFEERGKSLLSPLRWDCRYFVTAILVSLAFESYYK